MSASWLQITSEESIQSIVDWLNRNTTFLCAAFLTLYVLSLLDYYVDTASRFRNMPPGPSGLPFIGNQYQTPAREPWRKFEELNSQYGEN